MVDRTGTQAPDWLSKRKRRRGLSLSMAGHCRMELWLIDKGFEPEPTTPSAERVFEYGDVIETLAFSEMTVESADGPRQIGNWYLRSRVISDPVTDAELYPNQVENRQVELEVAGFKGHTDGTDQAVLITPTDDRVEPRLVNLDSKSANKMSFLGASKGPLTGNVFSRESLIQQQMYIEGWKQRGLPCRDAALIYSDKEKGGLMFRHVQYDQNLSYEGIDRLQAGAGKAEPRPDFEWQKGQEIPLRCGYCDMKWQCGTVRGQRIEGPIYDNKGRPKWTVMS